ncbi:MAG: V-type ATP synthase subunit F [Clostridia bacterium]|nr:V-type ATP synthase subunit F [Clostridia bacterium]
MYRIGVIGDSDSICGYAALGLDIFPVSDTSEASQTLKKLCAGDFAIIYITEQMVKGIESEIDRYSSQRIPAIIPIPGAGGSLGIGMDSVRKSVEKAVGSDILFGGK